MDVKISSKQEDRIKQPTLYVKMDLQKDQSRSGDEQDQQVMFQVSKGQLRQMLDSFEAINQQLTQMTAAQQ